MRYIHFLISFSFFFRPKNISPSVKVSPLHYLVGRKFEDKELLKEVITKMVEGGISINNNSNQNQETPLHYAVTRGMLENVQILLENGADINAINKCVLILIQICLVVCLLAGKHLFLFFF